MSDPVEIYASSPTGLRAQAYAAADEALRNGCSTLVLGLDNLAELDDAAVSAMIVALRKVREAGGSVRLVTANAGHRKHLAITGLDRIFEVVLSAENGAERAAGWTSSRVGSLPSSPSNEHVTAGLDEFTRRFLMCIRLAAVGRNR